ncbi:MAG TPA: hypothetical protein VFC86_09565 [Planctomycetota bacterium]|nr:hypothetical protein [Planctomycetota bacterium]
MTWERVALFALIFVVTLLGSLGVVLLVLLRLPETYFTSPRRPFMGGTHPVPRMFLFLLKNLAGVAVVAAGILMSIPGVPGQGFLTILIGLMLVDFPGKYGFERALIRRPAVHRVINRLRARFGRPPLEVPEDR